MVLRKYIAQTLLAIIAYTFISEPVSARTITILSVDGGGIRGIIPATFLAAIEKKSGIPLHEMFDVMVGTSTGGIISLGLSMPDEDGKAKFTAQDLLEMYSKRGNEIFDSSIFRQGVFRSKYDTAGLEALLEESFGEARISEALTNVIVTSFDLRHSAPLFMSSAQAKKDETRDFFMRDAARATSAAPTYFAPAEIYSYGDEDRESPFNLVDGGVIINNPAGLGFAAAHEIYSDVDSFLVVSVGTGEFRKPLNVKDVRGGGAVFWASPLINLMLNGVSQKDDILMRAQLPYLENREWQQYYRINTEISEEEEPMDDISTAHVKSLRSAGERMTKRYSEQIDQIVRAVQVIKGSAARGDVENILSGNKTAG